MCDLGLGTILGLASAGGQIYAGQRSAEAHRFNAGIADHNAEMLRMSAQIADSNADLALLRGNLDEVMVRRKGGQVLASQTAHHASGNVDAGYGSPLVLAGFSAAQMEMDAQMVRARMMAEHADALTGAANIYGKATEQRFRAASELAAGETAQVSSLFNAGTAFLTAQTRWPGMGGSATSSGSSGRSLAGNNPFGQ